MLVNDMSKHPISDQVGYKAEQKKSILEKLCISLFYECKLEK